MVKPLFRWTVGSCIQQGLDILVESIARTIPALGRENFDWMICYNGLDETALDFIRRHTEDFSIALYEQQWYDCPVDDEMQSPKRDDGTYEWNGNHCGGTLWKVCPARMRMESHEIVMDNDVIILKKFPEIDQFLNDDRVLILEEPIRFYGRYDELLGAGGPYLNSGLMGFPPGYDFGGEIRKVWEENGGYVKLSQADEQGLLMYTLSRQRSYRIKTSQMKEVLARDFRARLDGSEEGIHFTQSNKIMLHRAWRQYNVMKDEGLI